VSFTRAVRIWLSNRQFSLLAHDFSMEGPKTPHTNLPLMIPVDNTPEEKHCICQESKSPASSLICYRQPGLDHNSCAHYVDSMAQRQPGPWQHVPFRHTL
jgi:hypothetical protein